MRKELEIYIHIPFCAKKCDYCDFLSAPAGADVQRKYVDMLLEEIRGFELEDDYLVKTAFLGGGTPSLLPGEEIKRILEGVREKFKAKPDAEITIECNPGTLTKEKLEYYKEAGINRLSIGLQSAENTELKLLGRIHTFEQFQESFRQARDCGFTNINVDLMLALPGQTEISWEQTLKKVLTFEPEHISAYSLMIEEGTPFYARYEADAEKRDAGEQPCLLPGEDAERAMYEMTAEILTQAGYEQYEISNYAKPGLSCRHNCGYWKRTDYIGFGLGAASLQNPLRYKNTSKLSDYLEGDFSKKELLVLTKDNQIEETMFLGLRMLKGISKKKFLEQFGCPIEVIYTQVLQKLTAEGLLIETEDTIKLTKKGIDVSNYVLSEFLLD